MNKSNFNQTLGYPLTTERLQELQTSFWILNALGNLAGNFTIISGCEVTSNVVQNGAVFINGELFEFRKAALVANARVVIIQESITKSFKNGTIKEVHTIRYATFGTSTESWAWTDFKRPIQTKELQDLLNGKANNADITRLETEKLGTGSLAPLELRIKALEDRLDTAPSTQKVFVMGGQALVSDYGHGDNSENKTTNWVHITPPTGYTMAHLAGFIPSIGKISFSGDVNDNDVMWCRWEKEASKIVIWCNNSENKGRTIVNYLSIWIK